MDGGCYTLSVFIREIVKKNPGYDKIFTYHRLMESVRTPKGPRQRVILNLGKLNLPKEEWPILAGRIEEIITGQETFLLPSPYIESLASHYAQLLRRKEMQSVPQAKEEEKDWETVDLNSLSQGECRTIGGELVAYDAFRRLDLPQILFDLGFSPEEVNRVALLVIGRLLHPSSERDTTLWGKKISALDELLGTNFQHLSNNALYRLSDELVKHRDEIEKHLSQNERDIFHLGEKIILYDLTNTYLTGRAKESSKARYGRSKEKRSDCPLITLALVLDEDGFPKRSQVLEGSVSEPATLKEFLLSFKAQGERQLPLLSELPTVVIDAGIASEENLKLIKEEGFHYISVARNRPKEIPHDGLTIIKEENNSTIKAKRLDHNGEVLLYCESSARARKEESMKAHFQKHFEDGLEAIASSLGKRKGLKKYEKVMERLGRLRERYPTIAQFYEVDVEEDKGVVKRVTWRVKKEEELKARFSGSYYIRSDRSDLDEKELWSLYMMLTSVEEAFRCLKSDLGLRPVYHRKDRRIVGHLFITVVAYHLLVSIQRELKKKGIHHRWETIRNLLATQMRVTASLTNEGGERIYIRQTTDPEPFHFEIYQALGLPPKPLRAKRLRK
jgi:transposase